jgi:hypothetical protein
LDGLLRAHVRDVKAHELPRAVDSTTQLLKEMLGCGADSELWTANTPRLSPATNHNNSEAVSKDTGVCVVDADEHRHPYIAQLTT